MFLENALFPPRCFGIDPRRLVVGSGQSPDYIWLVGVDANKGVSRLLIPPPPKKKKRTRTHPVLPPPRPLEDARGARPVTAGTIFGHPFPPLSLLAFWGAGATPPPQHGQRSGTRL